MNSKTHDLGLLILRAMLGVVFIYHGAQKLFGAFDGGGLEGFESYLVTLDVPAPGISAVLAALAEFVGGLALITGFGQRLLSIPLAITMFVAAFGAHEGFDSRNGGMEYPLTLAIATVAMGLTGPGRFALGARSENNA